MNDAVSSENETEFHFVLNVIKEIRAASKRPDTQAILDHIKKTSATNLDRNHQFYAWKTTDIWQTIKERYVQLLNGTNEWWHWQQY